VTKLIDFIINILKWPIALASSLSIYPISKAVLQFFDLGPWLFYLLGGGLLYLVTARIFVGNKRQGWISTLEHELTHALFALITLHPVSSIQTTENQGGVISYSGGSNWLIVISPYFFPTFSFALVLIMEVFGATNIWLGNLLLGFTIFYHLISTKHELHKGQTDLQETGFLFAWLFLPGANLLSFGILFAFCQSGLDGIITFIQACF